MPANVLQVQQPSIAKPDKPTDMHIPKLCSHIEAMGGELDVIARFLDGNVRNSNFADFASPSSSRAIEKIWHIVTSELLKNRQ